jgi:hypothetical protein
MLVWTVVTVFACYHCGRCNAVSSLGHVDENVVSCGTGSDHVMIAVAVLLVLLIILTALA